MNIEQYRADVRRRGGVYTLLPHNTNLGPGVEGQPGARFPDRTTKSGWRYELAPFRAVASQSWRDAVLYPWDKAPAVHDAAAKTLNQVTDLANQIPSPPSLLSWVTGVPTPVLILVAAVVGWAVLQQAGIVPPIRKMLN